MVSERFVFLIYLLIHELSALSNQDVVLSSQFNRRRLPDEIANSLIRSYNTECGMKIASQYILHVGDRQRLDSYANLFEAHDVFTEQTVTLFKVSK